MKKSILEIYALAVCFIAVICFAVALGLATYSLVEIEKPEFTISSWQYLRHKTNDSYWKGCPNGQYCGPSKNGWEHLSEQELTKGREESFAHELSQEQRDGTQTLVKCLVVMLTNLLFFSVHWFVARRARANASRDVSPQR
ncbi:MAG: hypothetical protein PHP57_04095 [Sideroxydans sp.]|nr:hypothetical protein [Sideroxydans sp.]